MFKNLLIATPMWLILFILRVPFILLGLPIVAIALPFRRELPFPREKSWKDWRLIRLPVWAFLWDNPRDGALGDTRGKYWLIDRPKFLSSSPFLKMWWWLAVRNPAGGWSRHVRPNSVDVRSLKITLLAGIPVITKNHALQYQFVMGEGPIFKYFGLYALIPIGNRYINVRFGHKIEPKHAIQDFSGDPDKAIKGFTLRVLLDG